MKTKYQILLLIFLILLLYYISISSPVNSVDDYDMFNRLLNLDSINLHHLFFPHCGGYYRPVCTLTYQIDRFLWLLEESFYHLENILIHTINAVLVFLIALKLFGERYKYVPFYAALLFGVHPINTEAVNWISSRCDLLATMFSLSGFLIFLKFKESKYWLIGVFVASFVAFFGALSKEVGVAFYPAIAMWVLFFEKDNFKNRTIQALIFIAFGLFYFYFRHIALIHSDESVHRVAKAVVHHDYLKDILIIIQAFGFYVKKLFIPLPLNFGIIHISKIYLYVGFLVAFVSGLFLVLRKKSLGLFLVALWFVAPGTLVALGHVAWTPYAERYVYTASAFFSMFFVFWLFELVYVKVENGKLFYVALSLLIGLCFALSFQRNLVWSSNLSLYKDTVEKSPDFVAGRNQYAIALAKAGRNKKAIEEFKIAAYDNRSKQSILPLLNLIKFSDKSLEEKKRELYKFYKNKKKNLPNSVIKKILYNILYINNKIIKENPTKTVSILSENACIYQKLFECTHNGFYLYKEAQMYLTIKDYKKAKECLKETKKHLDKNSLYYKMADRLLKKIGD